jgi:hypothetical protein
MLNQKIGNVLKNGLPTALLEVVLIFFGITLAIGLDNWNAERNERHEELALLVELKSNLEKNLDLLNEHISFNEETVASYTTLLSHIGAKQPYSDDLSTHFAKLDHWASPYLTSSAYETIKSRGLDLISDSALRQEIVNLFEVDYVLLVNDDDRAEWINYEVSSVPLMLRHFEEHSDGTVVPIDYDNLLEDQSFRVAVKRMLMLRQSGISHFGRAEEATKQVIDSIQKVTSF